MGRMCFGLAILAFLLSAATRAPAPHREARIATAMAHATARIEKPIVLKEGRADASDLFQAEPQRVRTCPDVKTSDAIDCRLILTDIE